MKRIVTIQDISCFGKCSQTVAMPIISALGVETVPLPTAILSTHTGEFKDYSFLPLCDEVKKITEHWKKQQIKFDAIYIGYIGSKAQAEFLVDFIDDFADENTIVFLDPAMADNGEIYAGLDYEYIDIIRKLCSCADIIAPNIYEAMLLVDGEIYTDYDENDIERISKTITALCPKVIITGIHKDKKIATLGIDTVKNSSIIKENDKFDGMYYGTGDVFSSVFIGSYINGFDFHDAISFADDFIQECIKETLPDKEKYWYSINFEKCMHMLTDYNKKTEG
ncbi:MAG: pyridoxamine kinase [Clostridia bacterium]|nr:pyridoxamine kinase [Clostridia bacterium]